MVKNAEIQNYENLSENHIFEKAREELNPIQKDLIDKKITIDEAKSELKKINEWLQGTKLEKKDKKEIGKAFEKLMKLEKSIDEITLKNEVDEIINLLSIVTKKDLDSLKNNIKNIRNLENRSPEVQNGIEKSSANLDLTIHDATKDKNPIARKIGERMEKLMS